MKIECFSQKMNSNTQKTHSNKVLFDTFGTFLNPKYQKPIFNPSFEKRTFHKCVLALRRETATIWKETTAL